MTEHKLVAERPSRPPRWRFPGLTAETRFRLFLLAGLTLLLIYGSYRQRYIWGVDSFGYYQLGQLFSEGRIFLPAPFASQAPEVLVPWGFTAQPTGRIVPQYPPGFPLLLALGHLLRAPLWVTPMIGVISCAVLFGLLRTRVVLGTALLFTAAWALMPLTVYGSTMVMSDLAAATALMAGLLAYRHNRLVSAAWIFGLSIAIRPTNVLFLAPFFLLVGRERNARWLVVHLAAPCLLYAAYNHFLYGAPWRTGYGNVMGSMSVRNLPEVFSFFVTTTWTLLTPIVLGFAAVGLWRWNRGKMFLVLWALVFAVFYSCWTAGGIDRWWWARFILPGLPALFLLAAEGFESVQRWGEKFARNSHWWRALIALPVLAVPLLQLQFGRAQDDLWQRNTGVLNRELVERVREVVPAGSLVGTLEHASTFYLYSDLIPFVIVEPRAPLLVEEALGAGRRVFLLPEPWNLEHAVLAEIRRRFTLVEVARYDLPWPELRLWEVRPR